MMDLRSLRFERGVTIAQLAEDTGLSRSTIIRIEAGETRPTAPTAKALADYFHMSVSDLMTVAA